MTAASRAVGCALLAGALAGLATPDARGDAVSVEPTPASAYNEYASLDRSGPESSVVMRSRTTATERRVNLKVEWRGKPKQKKYTKSTKIPDIGRVKLTCKPSVTKVSLLSNKKQHETQMWVAKYEDKSYGHAVAVKTVRVYRHTSNPQHEGLNRFGGVENYHKGYMYGVISQRPGRHLNASFSRDRVTTFDLNWFWNGLDYGPKNRYCKIAATFVTRLRGSERLAINWHGEKDAKGAQQRRARLPGVGEAVLTCQTGQRRAHKIDVRPDNPNTELYAEVIQGEGRVGDQVKPVRRKVTNGGSWLGKISLPRNGMIRFFFKQGNREIPYLLSSYYKVNDPKAGRNLCEVAMGRFPS